MLYQWGVNPFHYHKALKNYEEQTIVNSESYTPKVEQEWEDFTLSSHIRTWPVENQTI